MFAGVRKATPLLLLTPLSLRVHHLRYRFVRSKLSQVLLEPFTHSSASAATFDVSSGLKFSQLTVADSQGLSTSYAPIYFEELEDFGAICSTALMTASLARGIASALNFSRPTQRTEPENLPTFI